MGGPGQLSAGTQPLRASEPGPASIALYLTLVEVSDPAIASVDGGGVADIEMAHERGEVGLGGGHHQVKVIVHKHVGMKLHLVIGHLPG